MLSAVMAISFDKVTLENDAKPTEVRFVTPNYLSKLGATMTLGRTFDSEAENGVVVSHAFWERRFSSDSQIVGKQIRLNGKRVRVAGVTAREFSGLGMEEPALWIPITQKPYLVSGTSLTDIGDGATGVQMFGRLRAGVTPRVAEEELKSLAVELKRQHPKEIWDKETFPSHPGGYAREVNPHMYPVLAIIAALCLLILTVACGNLGSLLLAKGIAREREIAIRSSVGAGRARLIRQLLTESLLLALLGAAAGLGLGSALLRYLMVRGEVPEWLSAAPDWRVTLFALAVGFASAILFGVAPAFQLTRQRHRSTVVRRLLIGGQVAASCVLLILSGLLLRALQHAISASPGFGYEQVISIDSGLSGYTAARAKVYLRRWRAVCARFREWSRCRWLPTLRWETAGLSTRPKWRGMQ